MILKKQELKDNETPVFDEDSLLEYYQTEIYADAESSALSLTERYSKHQFAWKVLGALYGQSGRNSDAVDANQKAVVLSPQDAEAYNNLGAALKELGRLDETAASYKQATALKPDFQFPLTPEQDKAIEEFKELVSHMQVLHVPDEAAAVEWLSEE